MLSQRVIVLFGIITYNIYMIVYTSLHKSVIFHEVPSHEFFQFVVASIHFFLFDDCIDCSNSSQLLKHLLMVRYVFYYNSHIISY